MTLAEKLKNARAAKHLSQRALAEATGLSLRTIQNYELGARLPKKYNRKKVIRWAKRYDWLFQHRLPK